MYPSLAPLSDHIRPAIRPHPANHAQPTEWPVGSSGQPRPADPATEQKIRPAGRKWPNARIAENREISGQQKT
jgi:hypothetical protein